ncbi:MAG: YraN family protein [Candidatus Liptonbacteria bacterium]
MSESHNKKLGHIGEMIAARYLRTKQYVILGSNYRKPFGEIDLIARAPDATLVFCEVKTKLGKSGSFRPEDQLTPAKLKRTQRISKFFANLYPSLINGERGWRIDLIAVILHRGLARNWKATIRHYECVG